VPAVACAATGAMSALIMPALNTGVVSLIRLPPCSPALNPVEDLWHDLRAPHWSNRPYRDYDELREEAVRSLCAVREDTGTIKTVCNAPYI